MIRCSIGQLDDGSWTAVENQRQRGRARGLRSASGALTDVRSLSLVASDNNDISRPRSSSLSAGQLRPPDAPPQYRAQTDWAWPPAGHHHCLGRDTRMRVLHLHDTPCPH